MFCTNCGSDIEDGSKFCVNCGATIDDGAAPANVPSNGPMFGAGVAPGETKPMYGAPDQGMQAPYAMNAQMPMGAQPPMASQQQKSSALPIVIAVLVVVIVALGAAIGVMAFTGTGLFASSSPSAVSTSFSTSSSSSASSSSASSSSSSTSSSTYNLSAYTTGGTQLSGTVRRDANDYVLADSSSRQYTLSELRALNLTPAEICIAWNEPFARLGFHFNNSDLQRYFNSCSWYTDKGIKPNLSGVASKNNELLRELANEVGDASRWKDLVAY